MKIKSRVTMLAMVGIAANTLAMEKNMSNKIDNKDFDPSTLLWYDAPAADWQGALPVGNGRLGAMVYGKHGEEQIQLNEETCWSGGPYSTVVKGGADALAQVQEYIFDGEPIKAHKLFGRKLMGYPVEQQKYQSLANLHLFFDGHDDVTGYKRWLDLNTGMTSVEYTVDNVTYRREVLASTPDQVIAIRLTASKPGALSFKAQLRGCRNKAHSNYATDYFQIDGVGQDGLMLNGKSADYMGIEGKLRYKAELKAIPQGGTISFDNDYLTIENADSVTMVFAAASNFKSYKDVSGNQEKRVAKYLKNVEGKSFDEIATSAIADYAKLFKRVTLELPKTAASYLPTDKRKEGIDTSGDANLAALCYNFARFALISSSRPGTQPANLQGIWNDDMNPSWDSKYTTNINAEMNYWHAQSGNLAELFEPMKTMVEELTDQGSEVAKEHYGADGWVFHQNTDIWRVAAPMDGPCWGTFTVGGAWLCNQLFDHYLYTGDEAYLKEIFPVMKGAVEFFLDFLIEDPSGKYLVTSPSTSPENPPEGPGYKYFFDEVTGGYYFTTICYGSSMDIQILTDLFEAYLKAENALGKDSRFAAKVTAARARLAPPTIGKDGTLQEWTEDLAQMEDKHRHFSHMYGLYPGNVISSKETPQYIEGCKAVLEQRGDGGKGFSLGWKMALWARLFDGDRANKVFKIYLNSQCCPQLFAKCGTALQIDGTMGVAAGITEMLVQSHEESIDLLPALPSEWATGSFDGVCVRGGFELDMAWENKAITSVEILSNKGNVCRIADATDYKVMQAEKEVAVKRSEDGTIEFETVAGETYSLVRK